MSRNPLGPDFLADDLGYRSRAVFLGSRCVASTWRQSGLCLLDVASNIIIVASSGDYF